jgi:hypothetical protein
MTGFKSKVAMANSRAGTPAPHYSNTDNPVDFPVGTPEDINSEYYSYLDDLRDSGVTNMFGAAPYLEREFGLDRREARDILRQWMDSF